MSNVFNARCKACGADNMVDLTKACGVTHCEYCNSAITLPDAAAAPETVELLRQGNMLLFTCEFDKAFDVFKRAAQKSKTEPEAYFGRALAKFKVQYLYDEVNKRDQPICYVISENNFCDDADYKKAVELSCDAQREEYIRRCGEIDSIRKDFYSLKRSGEAYDCFICCKVSDGVSGGTTPEAHQATLLHKHLTDSGFKPFYSEFDIRGRVGAEYESLILYALYSSKCMIVLCSNEDYLRTDWVRNEYTRFLRMIGREEKAKDAIAIAYSGSVIERLPGIDKKYQGVDFTKPDGFSLITKFVSGHVTPTEAANKYKYCLNCGEKNPEKAKRCMECGENEFVESYEKYIEIKTERELHKKLERERKKLEAEYATKLEAKRKEKNELKSARRKTKKAARTHISDVIDKARKKIIHARFPLMIVFILLELALSLFFVIFTATNAIAFPSVNLTALIAVTVVLGLILILDLVLIKKNLWKLLIIYFFVYGIFAGICIWIGLATEHMLVWMWVFFGVGIALPVGCTIWSLITDRSRGVIITPYLMMVMFAAFMALCSWMYVVQMKNDGMEDGFYYKINANGTVSVYVERYDMEILTIPEAIAGYRVTDVRTPIKSGGITLKEVAMPDTLISVSDSAFKGCGALKEIVFSANLRTIGNTAFKNCLSLETIILPDSVVSVGEYAFEGCAILSNVQFSAGMDTISVGMFKSCASLTTIHIPSNIRKISLYVFQNCVTLTTVTMDEGMRFKRDNFIDNIFNKQTLDYTNPSEAAEVLKSAQYNDLIGWIRDD